MNSHTCICDVCDHVCEHSLRHAVTSLCCAVAAADVIIKEQLQSLKHKEFETARLQCKVKNPKKLPVKWFKDGKEISPSDDSRYWA